MNCEVNCDVKRSHRSKYWIDYAVEITVFKNPFQETAARKITDILFFVAELSGAELPERCGIFKNNVPFDFENCHVQFVRSLRLSDPSNASYLSV